MTAHNFLYDSFSYQNYQSSDMIQPVPTFPEIQIMDENDYHEHMLLKSLDIKALDVSDLPTDTEVSPHCSLPNLHHDDDDDASYELIDEKSLEEFATSTPIKSTFDTTVAITSTSTTTTVSTTTHDRPATRSETKLPKSILKTSQIKVEHQTSMPAMAVVPAAKAAEIETLKKVSAEASTTSSTTSTDGPVSVDIPGKFDVLCGQSRICASHTGNRRFQVVLDIYAPTYEKATTKQEKMALTKEIVACISSAGGRFLKYQEGVWTEIAIVTARDKVSHALRTKVASWKRQKQSSPVRSRRTSKPTRSNSAVAPSTPKSGAASKHRKRRSSTSIAVGSFDSSTSSTMGDLLRAQREIFASLKQTESGESEVHPLKK